MGLTASLSGIRKTYNGTHEVLHGVDLELFSGEIHALLGANGSGKSTLVKILTGSEQPSAGTIAAPVRPDGRLRSPKDARERGIRVVHQETPFIDTMSVAENIALKIGYRTGAMHRIRWRSVRAVARDCLARLQLDIDPNRMAASLTASERGLMAMAIALHDGGEVSSDSLALVLDEATASVPEEEAGSVLRRVRALADSGVAVLMVTHRIREVLEFASRITVLDDGAVSYAGPSRLTEDEIVRLIVGRPRASANANGNASAVSRNQAPAPARTVLSVDKLTVGPLREVSFEIGAGEMLGLVGGPASGIELVASALAGLAKPAGGTIDIGGRRGGMPRSPRESISRGIALVPRDRLRQGAVASLSIFENVMLPTAGGLRYKTAARRRQVAAIMDEFDVVPRIDRMLVRELSGGNQQKAIVGKWMVRGPRVLILDDPTIGIDPGARNVLFTAIRRACLGKGLAVLLLSSEPEQLSEQCDRVIAIHDGAVVEELTGAKLSEVNVARWATA